MMLSWCKALSFSRAEAASPKKCVCFLNCFRCCRKHRLPLSLTPVLGWGSDLVLGTEDIGSLFEALCKAGHQSKSLGIVASSGMVATPLLREWTSVLSGRFVCHWNRRACSLIEDHWPFRRLWRFRKQGKILWSGVFVIVIDRYRCLWMILRFLATPSKR